MSGAGLLRIACLAVALIVAMTAEAQVRVVDDDGRDVVLSHPARRIVSLAPHATETLFEAGAGHLVVGTVKHADHPEAARAIPRVGDSSLIDFERIAALQPDLIVVWLHGNAEKHLDKIRKLGIPMYYDRPSTLERIPSSIERIGILAGTEHEARRAAAAFARRHAELRDRYAGRSEVRLFFQVWPRPLLTVNGTHIITDVIRLCGGRNVFADEKLLVPSLDVEAVVRVDPEALVRTTAPDDASDAFAVWRKLPGFRPTALGNLLVLRTDSLGRQSPRILDGAGLLCEELERVRVRRRP